MLKWYTVYHVMLCKCIIIKRIPRLSWIYRMTYTAVASSPSSTLTGYCDHVPLHRKTNVNFTPTYLLCQKMVGFSLFVIIVVRKIWWCVFFDFPIFDQRGYNMDILNQKTVRHYKFSILDLRSILWAIRFYNLLLAQTIWKSVSSSYILFLNNRK